MTWTTVLRPVHAWFFLWERLVPSVYRVVATGVAGLTTAVLLAVLGLAPLLAVGVAVSLWIALAIAQEHDLRVMLPPDPAFLASLTDAAGRSQLRLQVEHAQGPQRARGGTADSLVLSSGRLPGVYIQITRSIQEGWMEVHMSGDESDHVPFDERLRERGRPELAERVGSARAAEDDAHAVVEALEVVLL